MDAFSRRLVVLICALGVCAALAGTAIATADSSPGHAVAAKKCKKKHHKKKCRKKAAPAPAPPPAQTLSVTTPGAVTGSVSSDPAGISCGGTCSHDFAYGTVVTLTETPAVDFFTGWGGDCTGNATTCQVTMTQPRSVTASFIFI
jgi:hypothetical protein